jgi:two-component system, OmpR family, sensor histidine kinase TctE
MKQPIPGVVKAYSLRKRLLGFLLVPLIALLGISIITDYREGMHVANKAYDHALLSTALAVAAQIDRDSPDLDLDLPSQADAVLSMDLVDKVFYAVIDDNGRLLAGDSRLLELASLSDEDNPTYHFDVLGGKDVRVATYRYPPTSVAPKGATIVVAETTNKRETAAARIMVTTLWTDLLLIATSLAVVFFGIQYALIPLDRIGQSIEQRSPGDLSPIREEGSPSEVRPLLGAINRLMQNLREAGAAQQAFISSAAHQLRTPLAALQTQLELASESLTGDPLQRLHRVQDSAARLAHLTRQMLALARSSPDANSILDLQPVALDELLELAASDFIDIALERNIDLGFEPSPVTVQGLSWTLREMLSNLVDNALRYAGDGGRVTVRCAIDENGHPLLEVEDNGPGIPEEARERVFERFVRLDDQSSLGSGLGLAIVREVVQLHNGRVSLHTAEGGRGLLVRVCFLQSAKSLEDDEPEDGIPSGK